MRRKLNIVIVACAVFAGVPAGAGASGAPDQVTLKAAVRLADGSAGDPLKVTLPGIKRRMFKVRFLSRSSIELLYPARRSCASTRVRAVTGSDPDPVVLVRGAVPDADREGIINDPSQAAGAALSAWRTQVVGSSAAGGPRFVMRSAVVAHGTRNLPAPQTVRIDISSKTLRSDARCATVSRFTFGPGTDLLAPALAVQTY